MDDESQKSEKEHFRLLSITRQTFLFDEKAGRKNQFYYCAYELDWSACELLWVKHSIKRLYLMVHIYFSPGYHITIVT